MGFLQEEQIPLSPPSCRERRVCEMDQDRCDDRDDPRGGVRKRIAEEVPQGCRDHADFDRPEQR
jgi:hypothetical protein